MALKPRTTMPRAIVFDLETTGLPRRGADGVTIQPRIVTLAWILADTGTQEPTGRHFIVRPDGFTIPREATAIHGISTEHALARGEALPIVLDHLRSDIDAFQPAIAVAHNIDFDYPVLDAEFRRIGCLNPLAGLSAICTMKSTTTLCAIPRRGGRGFKWPTLVELHVKLFARQFDGVHDAWEDVKAAYSCFVHLARVGFWRTEFAGIQGELYLPYRDVLHKPCYAFACNHSTVQECLGKSLFGSGSRWPLNVRKDDPCLLYNYDTRSVLGLWVADESGACRLEPEAWGGQYPFQCRVRPFVETLYSIPRDNFPGLSEGRFPNPLLGELAAQVIRRFVDLQNRGQ